MTPTKIAAAIVGTEIVLAAMFGIAGATGQLHGTAYATPTPICFDGETLLAFPCPPCYEDEPCWDPCTMGNHTGRITTGVWVDCRMVVI